MYLALLKPLRFFLSCWLILLASFHLYGQFQVTQLGLETTVLPARMDKLSASSDGFVWLGGINGLMRIDGDMAYNVRINDPSVKIVHDQIIQSPLIEDVEGYLWFSTYSALHRLSSISGEINTYQLKSSGIPIRKDYRPFFYDSLKNELWLRAGKILWAYDVKSGAHRPLSDETTAISYSVHPLDKEGKRIIGTRWISEGVEIIDIFPNGKLATVKTLAENNKFICSLPISADSILLGSNDGITLLDLSNQSISLADFIQHESDSVTSVTSLLRISANKVLVACPEQGVGVLSLMEKEFSIQLKNEKELSGKQPDQLFNRRDGTIWLTQLNKGIDVISLKNNPFRLRCPQARPPIQAIEKDLLGNIYVLNQTGRLWMKMDHKRSTLAWRELLTDLDKKSRLKSAKIEKNYSFLTDVTVHPIAGRLLIKEEGIYSFDYQDGILSQSPLPAFQKTEDRFVNNFLLSEDSTILLNIVPGEVWRIKAEPPEFQIVNKINVSGFVYSAFKSKKNTTYIGSSNGLFMLKEDSISTVFVDNEQLPELCIKSIAEDDSGNIWLGTTNGLISYHPSNQEYTYFSTTDGLPSNVFTTAKTITDNEGEIWMATDAGLISFNPEKLLSKKNDRTPYFADIWVNEEPFDSDTASYAINSLQLGYLRNTLKFRVAAQGIGSSPVSGIRYQMLGYEDLPTQTPFNTTIRYPNLPPGTYTLQLTAINQNGLPSGQKSLKITINPPWWNTWWARVAALLVLALIAAAIYIAGLRRERLKQQRLSEQQARLTAERDRIAGEVHDDLGGQISSILYLSEEMLLTGATTDNAYELNRIHELSRTSLQNVRDIIFALDNRRATLAALGEQLRGAGTEFFTDRKITFTCTDTFARPDFYLTSRQKRNLTLIVKEAWHNTAKHAAATSVSLDISQANGTLHLTCSDNGKGFPN